MKLITFVVPSYNSEAYLHHAIDTLLTGGHEVEIIIVNDGSKDRTGSIADEYAAQFPDIVRAVHKENGGHGSGVNCGVALAEGMYVKVVDSDDWINAAALKEMLTVIRKHVEEGVEADAYFSNFVYDHAEDNTKFVRYFRNKFPVGKFFDWTQVKRFWGSQLLLMHSVMFKTQVIRDSGTVLPEHTFYVDNYFAYRPLPLCKKLYYFDLNLYHYFIGRSDQSVTLSNMTNRYDQQIRVTRCLYDAYTYDEIMGFDKGLRKYMLHMLGAVCLNAMMFCCSGGDSSERRQALSDFWQHTIEKDPKLSRFLRTRGLPVIVCWMPWKFRGWFMLVGYRVLCKINKLG